MDWKNLDEQFAKNITPILIVAIVAVSSFLVGSHLQPKQQTQGNLTTVSSQNSNAKGPSPIDEIKSATSQPSTATPTTSTTAPTATPKSTPAPVKTSGLININTATEAQLETLNGIGATKAQAIIDYRNTHGKFTSIDQLDNVTGIGPATIDKIRSSITI